MGDKCKAEESVDMSAEMQRLFKEKEKMRAAAREYFMKTIYNPYRPINAGPPFDPALQRFSAMSAYHAEYFTPSGRNTFAALAALFIPICTVYFVLDWSRSKKEAMYRAGLVRYEDRSFKRLT